MTGTQNATLYTQSWLWGTKTHNKNATPQAGVMATSTVFDAVQPHLVVAERTSDAGCNAAEVGHAALSRFSELHAQTGNVFIPQWKPKYLAEIFLGNSNMPLVDQSLTPTIVCDTKIARW